MGPPNIETITDFQKMVFIYNAVNDGWTTRLLSNGQYEFKKKDVTVTSDTCLDKYLKRFIEFYKNLNVSNNKSPN